MKKLSMSMFANRADYEASLAASQEASTPEPTRSQKLAAAGFVPRPTWRSLPSDEEAGNPRFNPNDACRHGGISATCEACYRLRQEASKPVADEPAMVIAMDEGAREPRIVSWNAFTQGTHWLYTSPQPKEPVADEREAFTYAKNLATALWERHWKETSPHWRPFDDVLGVLTQIDNMVSRLMHPDEHERALAASLASPPALKVEQEPEAMRLRNGNTALLEALMDMVLQHCCSEPDDLIRHNYLSANEAAVEILEEAGMIENDRLNWPALQRRKDSTQSALVASRGDEKDAARYRWLRHGDNDELVLMTYGEHGSRPFDARMDPCWLPRDAMLDVAIDAAMGLGAVGKGDGK